jgi:CMP-N,N'-diacetyllegionaminic acid synthase
MEGKRILGVIPARGGSKGVPGKNIKLLGGKPLVAYTIEAALKSKHLTDVVVSTEDDKIADICRSYGAEVPFKRPSELATDLALAVPTIQHAVTETERLKGVTYDIIVMLQPTTPMRIAEDIDVCLEKLVETNADSVISVSDVGGEHPERMKLIVPDGESDKLVDYVKIVVENRPRQDLEPVYILAGSVYATLRTVLMDQGTFKGATSRPFVVPADRAVNIDTPLDFKIAEWKIAERQEKDAAGQ